MKLSILLAILTIGCSATTYLVPEKEQEGIAIQETDQYQIITSVQDNSTIAIRGSNLSSTLKLFVFMKNQSRDTMEFVQESISVFGIEDESLTKLYTYEPNEYLKTLRQRHKLANALSVMEETIEYANPENLTIKTKEDVTERDGLIEINHNTETENNEANLIARQEIESEAIKEDEISKKEVKIVSQTLLSDYTLLSNETVFGDVMIKTKKFKRYLLIVPLGKDEHRIYFTLEKNERQNN